MGGDVLERSSTGTVLGRGVGGVRRTWDPLGRGDQDGHWWEGLKGKWEGLLGG